MYRVSESWVMMTTFLVPWSWFTPLSWDGVNWCYLLLWMIISWFRNSLGWLLVSWHSSSTTFSASDASKLLEFTWPGVIRYWEGSSLCWLLNGGCFFIPGKVSSASVSRPDDESLWHKRRCYVSIFICLNIHNYKRKQSEIMEIA